MTDSPKITDDQRQHIQANIAAMDGAIASMQKAAEPFVQAIEAIEGCRDKMLDDLGLEVVGHCEHCEKILFVGELGLRCDDGPVLCEEHAPTWDDARAQWSEDPAADEPNPDRADFMARYDAHIAAGGKGTDTFVHIL